MNPYFNCTPTQCLLKCPWCHDIAKKYCDRDSNQQPLDDCSRATHYHSATSQPRTINPFDHRTSTTRVNRIACRMCQTCAEMWAPLISINWNICWCNILSLFCLRQIFIILNCFFYFTQLIQYRQACVYFVADWCCRVFMHGCNAPVMNVFTLLLHFTCICELLRRITTMCIYNYYMHLPINKQFLHNQ